MRPRRPGCFWPPGLGSTASKVQSVSIARQGGLEEKAAHIFTPCPRSWHIFPVAIIEHMFYKFGTKTRTGGRERCGATEAKSM